MNGTTEAATAVRTNNAITVTLPTIVGDVWKDWRTAGVEANRLLTPGERASRSHEIGRSFYFLVYVAP